MFLMQEMKKQHKARQMTAVHSTSVIAAAKLSGEPMTASSQAP